jgi:NAD(P)-dependent dehydrogenase (short-subunit alcohol dehydrogenase family)
MGRGLLKERVAVITGAGQGIGQAIAREFADEGARVAIIDLDARHAADVAEKIRQAGCEARSYGLDVTDYTAVAAAFSEVDRTWGALDVLVNNAATFVTASILQDSLEDWRRQITVNLEAVYMGIKLAIPYLGRSGHGCVINMGSVHGDHSTGDMVAYDASKGGIVALTKACAIELAPLQIAVNAIAPGFIRTPASFVDGKDTIEGEEVQQLYVAQRRIPLGRIGDPTDIAGTAVFLASSYCRYLTGQVITVDGGLTSTF